MGKRKKFYKIKKHNGYFKIEQEDYCLVNLDLSCQKYSKVFQYKHAIIAKLVTGGYDFYLPSAEYDLNFHEYTIVDRPLTLIASNISEYLTYQDIFAFKKDSEWKFLLLHNFELGLDLENDIVSSLDKRLSELPSIKVGENTEASFKAGFEILYNGLHSDDKHHLAIFHADKDYLINAKEHNLPLYSPGIKINCLGLITKLSGGDGHFFKATYDEGESWYHDQFFDGITYGSIEPMEDTEYPSIYPSKDFSGYWKKNHDGIIVGLVFLSNTDSASFSLPLPCPATEVQFVKKMSRVNFYDGTDMIEPAFLWKIVSKTGEVLFLLISGNNYVTLPLEDFTN